MTKTKETGGCSKELQDDQQSINNDSYYTAWATFEKKNARAMSSRLSRIPVSDEWSRTSRRCSGVSRHAMPIFGKLTMFGILLLLNES